MPRSAGLLSDASFPVHLKKDFRNSLFCIAYEKVGSLRSIGREMGYPPSRGLNGPIREMWKGTSSIPSHRLRLLAKLAKVTYIEVEKNIVSKDQNQVLNDWFFGLLEYQKEKNTKKPTKLMQEGV